MFLDLKGIRLSDPKDKRYPLMMRLAGSIAGNAEVAAVLRELVESSQADE